MKIKSLCILALLTAECFAGGTTPTGNAVWDFTNDYQDPNTRPLLSSASNPDRQNPFTNAVLSLAIPGAGQLRTERYTKSVIFFAVEAAMIAYALINDKKGADKTVEFQRYADAHWSALRYAQWINTHGVTDYGPAISFSQSDFDAITLYKDFSKINEWERGLHRSGISHTLPAYGEQQYFELIGKYHQFKYGWDTYPQMNGIPISDGGVVDALVPQQLKDYAAERGKANDYYYAASFAASALIINHVVSAVDAFISTKSYNQELSASLTMRPVNGREGTRLVSELTLHVGL